MPMSIAPRIMAVYSSLLLTIVVDCSRAFHTPCIDVSGWALWQESYKPDVCLHWCICMHNATAKSSMQLVPPPVHTYTHAQIELKPYVLDGQMCDECHGVQCSGKPAPFFCSSVTCLQYFCEYCWATVHSLPGRQNHRPLMKDIGAERARCY